VIQGDCCFQKIEGAAEKAVVDLYLGKAETKEKKKHRQYNWKKWVKANSYSLQVKKREMAQLKKNQKCFGW
jgi:hypothetical protein